MYLFICLFQGALNPFFEQFVGTGALAPELFFPIQGILHSLK
jgi:hypothetical protein